MKRASTRLDKADWLIARNELWEDFPTTMEGGRWREPFRGRLTAITEAMRSDGLYSPKTALIDAEASVFSAIQFARFVRRNRETMDRGRALLAQQRQETGVRVTNTERLIARAAEWVFEVARCEEFGAMLGDEVIPCGQPAVAVVLSERGRRLYFMCHPHADHNVHHRDTYLVLLKPGTEWRD